MNLSLKSQSVMFNLKIIVKHTNILKNRFEFYCWLNSIMETVWAVIFVGRDMGVIWANRIANYGKMAG